MKYPKCPHCKHEFNDEEIWHTGSTVFPTLNDGDSTETFCLSCKERLRIVLVLEPSWAFIDQDGKDITV